MYTYIYIYVYIYMYIFIYWYVYIYIYIYIFSWGLTAFILHHFLNQVHPIPETEARIWLWLSYVCHVRLEKPKRASWRACLLALSFSLTRSLSCSLFLARSLFLALSFTLFLAISLSLYSSLFLHTYTCIYIHTHAYICTYVCSICTYINIDMYSIYISFSPMSSAGVDRVLATAPLSSGCGAQDSQGQILALALTRLWVSWVGGDGERGRLSERTPRNLLRCRLFACGRQVVPPATHAGIWASFCLAEANSGQIQARMCASSRLIPANSLLLARNPEIL